MRGRKEELAQLTALYSAILMGGSNGRTNIRKKEGGRLDFVCWIDIITSTAISSFPLCYTDYTYVRILGARLHIPLFLVYYTVQQKTSVG